ncbi:MAG: TetR/AcrR family transcriptional regulator C-terminal ligand-binding domain-containing protein [Mycolicibacterium neoaurum]|uniref:TetR/AcrR family transcriptional regulator n=1 Tax=Mycolicibacterium neoaurum TaxID=1795 RepID=UPI002FF582BC
MADSDEVGSRITGTALHLLRSAGPGAVTIQAVQAHSGIAKTTIYRRHQDRRAMLRAALSELMTPTPPPPRADTTDRLHWLVRNAVAAVDGGIGFGGFASLLTDEDPEFSGLFREVLGNQRAALVVVVDELKADGSIPADIDPEALIDAIVGAYVAERARTGRVGDWEGRLFDLLSTALRS